jgi:hypothetical protein
MTAVLPYQPPYIPTTEPRAGEHMSQDTALHSLVISAKRIADALDTIALELERSRTGR